MPSSSRGMAPRALVLHARGGGLADLVVVVARGRARKAQQPEPARRPNEYAVKAAFLHSSAATSNGPRTRFATRPSRS